MFNYVFDVAMQGAKYTGLLGLLACAIMLQQFTDMRGFGGHGGMEGILTNVLFVLLPFGVFSIIFGGLLFFICGVILYIFRTPTAKAPTYFALLGVLLFLIPFFTLIYLEIFPPLLDRRGSYVILIPSFIVIIIAGYLVGKKQYSTDGN